MKQTVFLRKPQICPRVKENQRWLARKRLLRVYPHSWCACGDALSALDLPLLSTDPHISDSVVFVCIFIRFFCPRASCTWWLWEVKTLFEGSLHVLPVSVWVLSGFKQTALAKPWALQINCDLIWSNLTLFVLICVRDASRTKLAFCLHCPPVSLFLFPPTVHQESVDNLISPSDLLSSSSLLVSQPLYLCFTLTFTFFSAQAAGALAAQFALMLSFKR